MTPPASPAPARHAPLDTLRGAAILAVFAYHAMLELNIPGPGTSTDPGWLGAVASGTYAYFVPQHLGLFGVQLFFVISGFCIHRSTRGWDARHPAASSRERWRAYAGRRFWRIYPLYALVLVALVLLDAGPRGADGVTPVETLAVHATMLHTLVPDHINLVNPSLWSLAVEAQWYALYPLVWLGFRRWGPARVTASIAVLALVWQFAIPALTRSTWVVHLPWRWGFEWILGAFVAETVASPRWPRGPVVAIVGVATILVLAPLRAPFLYATLPPIAFALLVAWAARRPARSSKPSRPARKTPIAALGRISYALYLVHQPALTLAGTCIVMQGIRTVDPVPFVLTTAAVFALTVVGAYLLERVGRAIQRLALRPHEPR